MCCDGEMPANRIKAIPLACPIKVTPGSRSLAWLYLLVCCLVLAACASAGKSTASSSRFAQPEHTSASPDASSDKPQLRVSAASKLSEVMAAVPQESLLERFSTYDSQGRRIDYLAFTDTEVGGIVFIDGRLAGSISRQMTQGFYICRGQQALAAAPYYWGSEVSIWVAGLLAQLRPDPEVRLVFTGKSTLQTIKSASSNPLVKGLRSVLGMGSNPLKVFNTLNEAHSQYEASEQYEKEEEGLAQLKPGMPEMRLVEVIKPQYLAFVPGGMLLGYPSHRIEYYMVDGSIRVIQQPEFHMLTRTSSASFYVAGINWAACNAQDWPQAMPAAPAAVATSTQGTIPLSADESVVSASGP